MKQVEIFHGDIGSVRNDLNAFINEEVEEIVSLTQSTTVTGHNTTTVVTVIVIYVPKGDVVKPKKTPENYL